MGTIATKLTYLNNTKGLFKDRLNSLGAEITSSTTFRNYLTWLDTFYEEVSDKTDLSVNGVVGRTSQDSTTGANLMPIVNVTKTVNGITLTNNGNGTITLNGTATAQVLYPITNTGDSTLRRIPVTENNYKFMLYGDTNVSSDTYFLQVLFGTETETTKFFGATDNGATSLHIVTDRSIGYALVIRKGQSFNNHIIKPMGVLSTYTGGFEPYTNGASPNPDYPQPINNLNGDVTYKVSGKNLFDKNNVDWIKAYLTNDGKMYTSGNGKYCLGTNEYIKVLPNTTYYLSCSYGSSVDHLSNVFMCEYDKDKNNIVRKSHVDNHKFTTESNTQYIRLSWYLFYDANNNMIETNVSSVDTYVTQIQIEKGSTATTYEPYIEPQTFTIPLGDIELGKITTYEDKIYSSNGRFYWNKNTGKVILDGSELVTRSEISPTYITDRFRVTIDDIKVVYATLSDRFITRTSEAQDREEIYSTANRYLYISINRSRLATDDVAGFKSWLSTHNTIVYYALATPITTEITQESYPSLYNALKQIQDYLTAYKINKEFILGYSSPEIEY